MRLSIYLALIGFILLSFSCKKAIKLEQPNVILIMADDMGYECLGSYGTTLYKTPALFSTNTERMCFIIFHLTLLVLNWHPDQ